MGSRVDVVIVRGIQVIPIEFKVEQIAFTRHDMDQAWDYALDLKNFHRASHAAELYPILVATDATHADTKWRAAAHDGVRPPLRLNADTLGPVIRDLFSRAESMDGLDPVEWATAPYHPTPTIIQAAQALYSRHSVDAIARSDAGAQNLAITSHRVEEVIASAEANREKAIVFVTGVPGAGKTLVGLNIATAKRDEQLSSHAVFLSGNGPLVAVLSESLARDELTRCGRPDTVPCIL